MHTSWGKLENLEILQLCRECVAMIVQTAKTAYNVCTLPKHVLIHRIKIPKTVPVCHVSRCEHAGAAPLLHRDGHHHSHGEGKSSYIMKKVIRMDTLFRLTWCSRGWTPTRTGCSRRRSLSRAASRTRRFYSRWKTSSSTFYELFTTSHPNCSHLGCSLKLLSLFTKFPC